MSVERHLGLDERRLAVIAGRWPEWLSRDRRLAVVEDWADLLAWRESAAPGESAAVLSALAEMAAGDGGDDPDAASALAACLLPAAKRLAREMHTLVRGTVPVPLGVCEERAGGVWSGVSADRCDELVGSLFWMACRSVPWRRVRGVGSHVYWTARRDFLTELGAPMAVRRSDPAWSRTVLVDPLAMASMMPAEARTTEAGSTQVGADAGWVDPRQEVEELLAWGLDRGVITEADRAHLRVVLDQVRAHPPARESRGPLLGLAGVGASQRVARIEGIGTTSVRRWTSRVVRSLASARREHTGLRDGDGPGDSGDLGPGCLVLRAAI